MSSQIETIDGLFGEKLHYKDGEKVGESWPGLFGGTYNHYDRDGAFIGESMPGVFADEVHYDSEGRRRGVSCHGAVFTETWMDDGSSGETMDSVLGSESLFDFDPF